MSIDLKYYTFLDVDLGDYNKEEVYNHFLEHKDCYIRKSVSGNFHVIIKEPCEECSNYSDTKFFGKRLFDNKGKNFAENKWFSTNISEKIVIPSTTVIQIIGMDSNKKLIHYYLTSFKLFSEKLEYLNKLHSKFYYTFNLVVMKDEDDWIQVTNESNGEEKIDKLIEVYNLKEFIDIQTCYGVYCSFLKSISLFNFKGFKYNVLTPEGIIFKGDIDYYVDGEKNKYGNLGYIISQLRKDEWWFSLGAQHGMSFEIIEFKKHIKRKSDWLADVGRKTLVKYDDIKKILLQFGFIDGTDLLEEGK